jgi:hypothetical protein
MQTVSNFHRKLLMGFFLSATLLACKRDRVPEYALETVANAVNANGNAAAAHIAASEKLVIPAAIELPANLPGGNLRVATYYAEGVQKYVAREKAGSNPISYEWAFVAPEAFLYDATNAMVGTHGAGPFWELSINDSIFAQHFSPARTALSPDPGSIDWLLLMPKIGTTPTGIFSEVDYIQRIATKGGKAPTIMPSGAGETVAVKYKAVYRFSKKAA